MKRTYVKLVFLLCFAYVMTGCFFVDDEDETLPLSPPDTTFSSMDGYWDRGDIIIYVDGDEGYFFEINYGSWENALQNGFISFGSLKFRSLSKQKDGSYFGENLWVKSSGGEVIEVKWTINTSFVVEDQGNTLLLHTRDPWDLNWIVVEYTRVNP